MKILFVASLHHPEALRAAREQFGADVLFPPSMAQHFWEKALRKRGHTLDVFWRNSPGAQNAAPQRRDHARQTASTR